MGRGVFDTIWAADITHTSNAEPLPQRKSRAFVNESIGIRTLNHSDQITPARRIRTHTHTLTITHTHTRAQIFINNKLPECNTV